MRRELGGGDTRSLISPSQDKDIMSSMQIFHNVL